MVYQVVSCLRLNTSLPRREDKRKLGLHLNAERAGAGGHHQDGVGIDHPPNPVLHTALERDHVLDLPARAAAIIHGHIRELEIKQKAHTHE